MIKSNMFIEVVTQLRTWKETAKHIDIVCINENNKKTRKVLFQESKTHQQYL